MNAKPFLAIALAAMVGLALAPAASAQPFTMGSTAPAAAQAPEAQPPVPGQATTPLPTPKVTRASTGWDPQAPPPPPAPPAPVSPAAAPQAPKVAMPMMQMPKGQLVNVKVEFTITDQIGTKPPTKKTMTLTVADRENGRIRTTTEYPVSRGNSFFYASAPLSVDVQPVIEGGKIRLEFSLEYSISSEKDPSIPGDAQGPKTNVSERLSAILESGVPLVIAQSSDAVTERRLTIEVKATIVK
jgi:hypothetical protein